MNRKILGAVSNCHSELISESENIYSSLEEMPQQVSLQNLLQKGITKACHSGLSTKVDLATVFWLTRPESHRIIIKFDLKIPVLITQIVIKSTFVGKPV